MIETETTLLRYDKDRNNEKVEIVIEYGTDYKGERDWTMSCDKLNIVGHSSGGWGSEKINNDINLKEKECIKWFKGMLNEDGYFNIEVVRYEQDNKVV